MAVLNICSMVVQLHTCEDLQVSVIDLAYASLRLVLLQKLSETSKGPCSNMVLIVSQPTSAVVRQSLTVGLTRTSFLKYCLAKFINVQTDIADLKSMNAKRAALTYSVRNCRDDTDNQGQQAMQGTDRQTHSQQQCRKTGL